MRWWACVMLAAALAGCGGGTEQRVAGPEPIAEGETCHLCGMLIRRFPGPKGEAVDAAGRVLKFCSTRDLFAWALDPEHRSQVQALYVHDMAQSPWEAPDDRHLVDGRKAWYVVGHPLKGAMGHTLASFARRDDAEAFAARYPGARVLRFEDLTVDLIARLPGPAGG
ncbi:nitrous oxide reductase accessory protein NosL [Inmirania thermothiophila]|uniref:Copper chaperone NosL n=1 Tax=Inmirania thermothiophila TaxID=1750597 RepID=A0A3N1Y532_9GAMM|nr:nitrous oxide reductase accessory protein NosL [Inmirania thermothiophila]ROR32387.1 copper chaperone NosL [Inmirania thermothiophila]